MTADEPVEGRVREEMRRTVEHVWLPVEALDPQLCGGPFGCGHVHPAWQEYVNNEQQRMAPQWTWCIDPGCKCQTLRPIR